MTSWQIIEGDCVDVMAGMATASVDAIVTDPPYGLGFMGREWDSLPPGIQWARQCLRVLKPGGHLLAFGGTRTYHRLACAIEDAGFEIRDCLAWLYGSGFPKSLDVSKAIDKAAGAERTIAVARTRVDGKAPGVVGGGKHGRYGDFGDLPTHVTTPATSDAQRWHGWGTALKPAHEPIVMARKPLAGTVAGNVLEHGTGALNVDGCRLGERERTEYGLANAKRSRASVFGEPSGSADFNSQAGRWPPNVVLGHHPDCMTDLPDEASLGVWDCHADCAVRRLDAEAGERRSAGEYVKGSRHVGAKPGAASIPIDGLTSATYADRGGASRFFYVAKASSAERNAGLGPSANVHPTVKPIDLMRWLCRLVTPPGGLVLDPFTGSGTTGIAALREGFNFDGIEREAEYVAIARARIIGDAPLLNTDAEAA